jgi:hypothetical protein
LKPEAFNLALLGRVAFAICVPTTYTRLLAVLSRIGRTPGKRILRPCWSSVVGRILMFLLFFFSFSFLLFLPSSVFDVAFRVVLNNFEGPFDVVAYVTREGHKGQGPYGLQ